MGNLQFAIFGGTCVGILVLIALAFWIVDEKDRSDFDGDGWSLGDTDD